ncbi:tetratricopeptide repeat protein [Acidobacteria bacterium AH-259-O06]|nr:tetratricopeptide repeat protein [Acidobacteria bacterium AH-259-O06]
MTTPYSFRRNRKWIAALFLLLATFTVYLPVWQYEFVDLDDDLYVANPRVRLGLTWGNVWWALTAVEAGFWHPLTWWSHMLDSTLFGLNPAGHHLMNLLLHLTNVLLLFWVLQELSGAVWCSFFVAALFALHPLNVESVAWIAERNNVLSTMFWLLTMWAYVGYVRKPGWARYLKVIVLFVLGLMAKPMLVTLPGVLLLLDYWPLGRLGSSWSEFWQKFPKLGLEKIPFLVLAVASGILAIHAQYQMGAIQSLQEFPFDVRLANALVAYMTYLAKMIWPTYLVVVYPHPGTSLPGWHIVLAVLVLTIISALVLRTSRSFPYLLVGWLWYLGTLLPVSGLIQVGIHGMADRYAYVPLIGVFILLVWGSAEWFARSRVRKELWVAAAVCLLMGLSMNSRLQLGYWQNGVTLLEHAIRSTDNNYLAHNNLGTALLERGRLDEAIQHFSKALEIKPSSAGIFYNLGLALKRKGERKKAAQYFSKALELNPGLAEAHNNLGAILMAQGQLEQAIQHLVKAVEINPTLLEAHNNLGTTLAKSGQINEAIAHFSKALEINPRLAKTHNNLAAALDLQGRSEEAIHHYRRALQLDPGFYLTHSNLGKALMEKGDLVSAARHFFRAIEIQPDFAEAHYNLGLVRREQGRIEDAIECFRQVLKVRPDDTRAQHSLALLLKKEDQ